MSSFVTEKNDSCLIDCRVQPSASKTAVSGIYNNTHLKILLAAPPVDGKANKALRNFLAKKLNLSKSSVTVVKGLKNRLKTVECTGITEKEVKILLDMNDE